MLSTLRPCCVTRTAFAEPRSADACSENSTPQRPQSPQERANAFFLEVIRPAIVQMRCRAWSEAQLLDLLLQIWNVRITPKAKPVVMGKSESAVRQQVKIMVLKLPKTVIEFASDTTEDEQRILFESIKTSCSSQGREELIRAAGWQPGTTTEDDSPDEA